MTTRRKFLRAIAIAPAAIVAAPLLARIPERAVETRREGWVVFNPDPVEVISLDHLPPIRPISYNGIWPRERDLKLLARRSLR